MTGYSPADLSRIARSLYTDGPLHRRKLQIWRPYICPFGPLIEAVPEGSTILDVGCGGGLFLGLLASLGRISHGMGFDSSKQAIEMARTMMSRLPEQPTVVFEHRPAGNPWPGRQFDVVSMIDVIHHVRKDEQINVLEKAAERVKPGGLLLYKDISSEPAWQVWASRIHDLVFARQWIHVPSFERASASIEALGLQVSHYARERIFWYGHEMAVFRRPSA